MAKAIINYDPKLPKLTKNQLQVLELLIEAAELIEPIYALQENPDFDGANFYPKDASKIEIDRAANKNKYILSPYTIVEKSDGKLVATPYHIKFANLLKPVVERLIKASKITDNKEFGEGLRIQAKALLEGTYDAAQIYWLSIKPYILDINIGPIERYDDKLYFIKTSYQAWVGVMDVEQTKILNEYCSLILSARRQSMMPSEKVDYYDKVQSRVDDVVIFSGLIARTKFIGVNLPNDVNLTERYGSEITIFNQPNESRLHAEIFPAFSKVFSKEFKENFSKEDLETGSLYFNVLHELAHTYLRFRNAEKRFGDLFPIVDELAAYVMGIRVCGSLLLKDIMSQHRLESIMVAFIAKSFHMALNESDDKARYHYTQGHIVFLNYLLESGAIRQVNGISWPNFTKMFFALSELASILERMLSSGNRDDASKFINQYNDFHKISNL